MGSKVVWLSSDATAAAAIDVAAKINVSPGSNKKTLCATMVTVPKAPLIDKHCFKKRTKADEDSCNSPVKQVQSCVRKQRRNSLDDDSVIVTRLINSFSFFSLIHILSLPVAALSRRSEWQITIRSSSSDTVSPSALFSLLSFHLTFIIVLAVIVVRGEWKCMCVSASQNLGQEHFVTVSSSSSNQQCKCLHILCNLS